MPLPLTGLRVIDFSRVLAGPHCAKHLLDLGAEVIKVEPPAGDLSRLAPPFFGGVSGYYAQQNAGKRNLSIDLNVAESRQVVRRLCQTADIIVENFRPGALASFGLDYDAISATNPGVVYASISGYGQRGSWRNRMAYAPTIQAEAGFTTNTHQQFAIDDDHRQTDGLSHADVYSGLHATIALLAALNHRNATGEGQYIDVAMAAVIISMNERIHYDLSDANIGPEPPALGATQTPFFTSPDGTVFVIPMSLVGTGTFEFYLRVMRRPDLADDPRFRTAALRRDNIQALHHVVQKWILTFDDMASLDAQLDEAKLATGTVRDVKEFAETEWAELWGSLVRSPIDVAARSPSPRRRGTSARTTVHSSRKSLRYRANTTARFLMRSATALPKSNISTTCQHLSRDLQSRRASSLSKRRETDIGHRVRATCGDLALAASATCPTRARRIRGATNPFDSAEIRRTPCQCWCGSSCAAGLDGAFPDEAVSINGNAVRRSCLLGRTVVPRESLLLIRHVRQVRQVATAVADCDGVQSRKLQRPKVSVTVVSTRRGRPSTPRPAPTSRSSQCPTQPTS